MSKFKVGDIVTRTDFISTGAPGDNERRRSIIVRPPGYNSNNKRVRIFDFNKGRSIDIDMRWLRKVEVRGE